MTDSPFFSIVYPTKNRHFLIKYCLESMILQQFKNFELIIHDNSTDSLTKRVVEKFLDDKRIKYFKNIKSISMSENWELALSKTTGKFISVLTDKTILYLHALKKVHFFLKDNDCEVVNWRDNSYFLVNEDVDSKKGYDRGVHGIKYKRTNPKKVNQKKELQRMFSQSQRRGTEEEKYFWGKICFGVYKRDLIKRILEKEGNLFYGISPDYSSKIKALCYANSIYDIGDSLQLSFNTKISNGGNNERYASLAKNFILSYNKKNYFKKLPISFLYSSLHNIVAYDFKSSKKTKNYVLNKKNFLLRVKEDLFQIKYESNDERKAQYNLFQREFKKLPINDRLSVKYHFIRFVFRQKFINVKLMIAKKIKYKPKGKIYNNVINLLQENEI